MANQMRACPYWKTISEEIMPTSAPTVTQPRIRFIPSAFSASATGARAIERSPVRDPGQYQRDRDIEHGANDQRGDDPHRHIALRIPAFLRRGRDGIESDVGEEYDGRRRSASPE